MKARLTLPRLRPLARLSSTAGPLKDGKARKQVIADLVEAVSAAARREVPWFEAQMPPAYFRQVTPERRGAHLRALTALTATRELGRDNLPEVQLRDEGAFTFMTDGPGNLNAVVERQLAALPAEAGLRRVLLFTSADGRLGLNTFETTAGKNGDERRFGAAGADSGTAAAEAEALEKIAIYEGKIDIGGEFAAAEAAQENADALGAHAAPRRRPRVVLKMDDFLSRCPSSYVVSHGQTPWLLRRQKRLYEEVAGSDDMAVELSRYGGSAVQPLTGARAEAAANLIGSGNALLTLAIPETTPREALRRTIALLNLHGLELQRAQVDVVNEHNDGGAPVTLLRAVVSPRDGDLLQDEAAVLVGDAARLKWVSDFSYTLAGSSKKGGAGAIESIADAPMTLLEAEVALALADLSGALLDHPLLTRESVRERLQRPEVQPVALQLASAFIRRFEPAAAGDAAAAESSYADALAASVKEVDHGQISDEQSRELLRAMASAAKHTLRANVHVEGRWALSLRLDPRFFAPVLPPVAAGFSNLPYGTFFIAGRHFNGYHNRFRDIARGGLRVVLPPSAEAHTAESRRHFGECFGLSWAQQLKNKDIPEGGSKAVCLVTPVPAEDRTALMHGCVKKMADAMLDLIVPSTADKVVTRAADEDASPLGDEFIYLGPDENITPVDLDWIVARAARRGYAMPSAFMSSKPRAGINHKEYGVTSEGVAVFLREALTAIGIAPTAEPWTVKLTGGPDGDVAGNMLKILSRDYGDNVRVVGLADGTASAEDPDGLPMSELLRLADASLPLAELNASKLGANGALTLADSPAGIAARNTMHNRVVADAFVPAGGRPATMNGSNWKDFLREDGTPSARVIVEGANLFLTPEARLALFESCGLPVVKDSSANKCGVICSSMEIRASMCVSDDEFVTIKPQYVEEVLAGLREMAGLEAKLLFAEAARDTATPLPALSERISFAILRVADALAAVLDDYSKEKQLWPLVATQLPPALAASEAHAAVLPDRLPWEYQKSTVAKSLASRLVYREGLAFVEGLGDGRLPAFALAYLEQEQRVRGLADQVAASGAPFAPEVEALLLQGGVRVAAEQAANEAT